MSWTRPSPSQCPLPPPENWSALAAPPTRPSGRARPLAAWVLRIARNHCIDLLRRRRPTLALAAETRSDDGPETGVAPELPDHFAVTGEQRVQEEEAQRDLDRAVAALPARYREVIALFHIQHRSYAEIAETLKVPIGTVMTWLHRARKELKARLSEHLS